MPINLLVHHWHQLSGNNAGAINKYLPGFLLACVIAAAAKYLSEHYGGPAMLYALLIGMAFNYLATSDHTGPGITMCTQTVLRIGVALLGLRITLADISALGFETAALTIGGVAFTIITGAWGARLLGLSRDHAVLSAGAVAICGASAALAIAAFLPKHENSERNTILTVAGVTTLSTVAMTVYPLISAFFALDDRSAGIFIGATIHDVAQVIGAGYTISDEAGEVGAIVKLLRVACLLPAVIIISMFFRKETNTKANTPPIAPWFLLAFILLVAINSLGLVAPAIASALSDISAWCLLIAVAALGVKTSLKELSAVGPRPLLALTAQTVLLAAFILIGMHLLGYGVSPNNL